MSNPESGQTQFTARTGQLIRRCLRGCSYHDDLIVPDYPLTSDCTVPFVAFAHRPHDARSSCIAFLPESRTPHADLIGLRELGVPLAFIVGESNWEMWSLRTDGPRLDEKTIAPREVENFFESRKKDFAPGSVFRAKTWARAEGARQLDFVDTGFLPIVEQEAGARLRQLFEDMVGHTMDSLGMRPTRLNQADAHWLVRSNFWLLAGKLLRDKQVEKFRRLDLNNVQDVFDRVAEHYDAGRVRANGRLAALRGAADVAAKFSSLRSISTETLGALYEEALLSKRTRKLLSVHRTPTYLVDYMLAKLSGWIENEIGIENCRVFEAACGHAPFLVGSVRLLSDLLPKSIASDRAARRQFLRKHIGGCDRDDFALEIARLSLTLADIPNPNGWRLDAVEDMFDGSYLAEKIAASSVIIANPPFEGVTISAQERKAGDLRYARSGQAGELVRRIVKNATPGTLFAVVLPQAILDGASFRSLRQDILSKIELKEIVAFPDNVFKFAKPETAIIFGRKLRDGERGASSFRFRRVSKPNMEAFNKDCHLPEGAPLSIGEVLQHPRQPLLLPPLGEFWRQTAGLPRIGDIVTVSIGFYFYPVGDPNYPAGEIQFSETEKPGFYQGYRLAQGSPYTHLTPKLYWLNQKPEIIDSECGGIVRGQPQVLINKARASRSKWRHKAFIDAQGRPFNDRFICFRPQRNVSLNTLWAIVNSPLANAFTFAESPRADFSPVRLGRMPFPVLRKGDTKALDEAVDSYFEAARRFSIRFAEQERKRPGKNRTVTPPADEALELPLEDESQNQRDDIAAARETLRALHWRVDAEVLKL